jgi:hypothetical protein
MKERHHFQTTRSLDRPVSEYDARDSMKRMKAQQQGITLITVPFWWDRSPQRYFGVSLSLFFMRV